MDIKINSIGCTYLMGALSIDQIKAQFAKLHGHIPELKIVVSEALEKHAKFQDFTEACVVLGQHAHSKLIVGTPLRNNEVVFWSPTVQSPGVYSCSGNLEL